MVDQKLFDLVLSNALDVFRLTAHEQAKVLERLRQMEQELLRQLNEDDLTLKAKSKIKRVIKQADKIIDAAYADIQTNLNPSGIGKFVADSAASALSIVFGAQAINVPLEPYFKSLASDVLIEGSPAADWWRGQSEDIKFKFAGQVRQGAANGETNQQIISRIVGKSGQSGVMEVSRKNASTLVQTSVQAVANDARRNTWQANDDLVKGIRQVSTLDSHTSITCVAYSGESWDLNYKPLGPKKLPFNGGTPRHFGCRSVEVPITKTFRELGIDVDEAPGTTRASSSGQIDVNTNFDDYLKRMGEDYQEEVLGKGRADLWRAKKITLKDLVNGQGRPVSLEALHAKVKRRAGQ